MTTQLFNIIGIGLHYRICTINQVLVKGDKSSQNQIIDGKIQKWMTTNQSNNQKLKKNHKLEKEGDLGNCLLLCIHQPP